jgi:hypothetical protein
MIYLVEARTKPHALAAVEWALPENWKVDDVIGVADPAVVALHRPRLERPERL